VRIQNRAKTVPIIAGVVALLLGFARTYDLSFESSNRLLGGPLVSLMLLGPALIAVGIALLAVVLRHSLVEPQEPSERRTSLGGGRLKVLGGALMIASVGLVVLGAATGSEIIGLYSTMSLFVLALPGLGVFAVGSFLRSTALNE
jgi:hypothetical protein